MRRILSSTTFALLIVLGSLPVSGAQGPTSSGSAELSYTDPKGDAGPYTPMGSTPSAGVPTPLTDAVDLVSFRIFGEDQEALYIEIGVNQIKPSAGQAADFTEVTYETQFRI